MTRLIPLLLLVMVALGCKPPAAADSDGPPERPYRIVATVGMVGDIARAVAGDLATVEVLMGEGTDPHLYKASRDDVGRMSDAHVVLYVGLMLEGKMTDALERLAEQKPVVAVAEALDENRLIALDASGGEPDPHVWGDPDAWAGCVDVVAEALAVYDPANAAEYRSNAEAYKSEVAQLASYGQRVLNSVPADKRLIITSHDAFNYFGREFDLEVLGVQGLSTESEAGLRRVNELVDLIVERQVPAVFVESSVPRKSIEALVNGAAARGHRVAIGGTLYSDAMGSAGTYEGTYIGMIDHNITTVARALGGDAPARGMGGKLAEAAGE